MSNSSPGAFSYSRYDRIASRGTSSRTRNRTALAYWLPLALTVTAASIGVATWIWRERAEESSADVRRQADQGERNEDHDQEEFEEEDVDDKQYIRSQEGQNKWRDGRGEHEEEEVTDDEFSKRRADSTSMHQERIHTSDEHQESGGEREMTIRDEHTKASGGVGGTLISRVSDAIRRTPSPLHFLERMAGRTFGFGERERWEEEVQRRAAFEGVGGAATGPETVGVAAIDQDARRYARQELRQQKGKSAGGRRKIVAVVLDASPAAVESQTSEVLMSCIPQPLDTRATQLLVLVYAPHLAAHPLSANASLAPRNVLYDHITRDASLFLAHESHLLPFTFPDSHVNLLRHIKPDVVYVVDSLAKEEVVDKLREWVGQISIVMCEADDSVEKHDWWIENRSIRPGRGVDVVNLVGFGDDWTRKVGS